MTNPNEPNKPRQPQSDALDPLPFDSLDLGDIDDSPTAPSSKLPNPQDDESLDLFDDDELTLLDESPVPVDDDLQLVDDDLQLMPSDDGADIPLAPVVADAEMTDDLELMNNGASGEELELEVLDDGPGGDLDLEVLDDGPREESSGADLNLQPIGGLGATNSGATGIDDLDLGLVDDNGPSTKPVVAEAVDNLELLDSAVDAKPSTTPADGSIMGQALGSAGLGGAAGLGPAGAAAQPQLAPPAAARPNPNRPFASPGISQLIIAAGKQLPAGRGAKPAFASNSPASPASLVAGKPVARKPAKPVVPTSPLWIIPTAVCLAGLTFFSLWAWTQKPEPYSNKEHAMRTPDQIRAKGKLKNIEDIRKQAEEQLTNAKQRKWPSVSDWKPTRLSSNNSHRPTGMQQRPDASVYGDTSDDYATFRNYRTAEQASWPKVQAALREGPSMAAKAIELIVAADDIPSAHRKPVMETLHKMAWFEYNRRNAMEAYVAHVGPDEYEAVEAFCNPRHPLAPSAINNVIRQGERLQDLLRVIMEKHASDERWMAWALKGIEANRPASGAFYETLFGLPPQLSHEAAIARMTFLAKEYPESADAYRSAIDQQIRGPISYSEKTRWEALGDRVDSIAKRLKRN